METFADAVGLRRLGFGAGVIDVLHGEAQLILMALAVAAVLRTAVGQGFPAGTRFLRS